MQQNKIIAEVGKGAAKAGEAFWDAYMRGFNLQQEAQRTETQIMLPVLKKVSAAGARTGIEGAIATAVSANLINNSNQQTEPKDIAITTVVSSLVALLQAL